MGGRSRAKKERNRPIMQIIAVEGMTEESMKRSIKKLIGDPPIKVQCMGGNLYRLTFNDYDLAKKLLAFHSRKIAEGGRPLQISLVEQSFNALEIFEMLHDKLANRERVDSYHVGGEKEREKSERGNTREVSVDTPSAARDPPAWSWAWWQYPREGTVPFNGATTRAAWNFLGGFRCAKLL